MAKFELDTLKHTDDKSINEEKKKFIVTDEDGVIYAEMEEGDKIIHNKDTEDGYKYSFNKEESFVKMFDGNVLALARKTLSAKEFMITYSLAQFVSYEDCILRSGGHGNGKFLDIKDLAEIFEMEYDTFRRHINSLIKKDVLSICYGGCVENPEIKLKAIIVNPWLYMRGNKVNKTVLGIFENSAWNTI